MYYCGIFSHFTITHTLLSFKLTSPSVISAKDLSPLILGSSASVLARHLVTASICFITRCIVRSVVSNLFCSSVRCFLAVKQERPKLIKHSSTCEHKKYITNNLLSFGVRPSSFFLHLASSKRPKCLAFSI